MVTHIDAYSHVLPKAFLKEMIELYPTDELREMANADHLVGIDN